MSEFKIDAKLLELLACPENYLALRVFTPEELKALNERISKGEILDLSGAKLTQNWEIGLIRVDGKRAYPVENGLPILLIESGVNL